MLYMYTRIRERDRRGLVREIRTHTFDMLSAKITDENAVGSSDNISMCPT